MSTRLGSDPSIDELYNDAFYDQAILWQGPGAFSVALAIFQQYRPSSVIDLGCGPGTYLIQFRLLGVRVFGLEWSAAGIRRSRAQYLPVVQTDLSRPVNSTERADLAICFEVAEHLPISAGPQLVSTITEFSDSVVFTAATPGQGGTGHLNERPLEYWDGLFYERGYGLEVGRISSLIDSFAKIPEVNPWLLNNTRCYQSRSSRRGAERRI